MKKAKATYASAGVSRDVKQFTAEFVVALLANGVAIATILVCLARTFYSPAKSTLDEHIAAVKAKKEVVLSSSAAGPPPKLSEEELGRCCGMNFGPKHADRFRKSHQLD
jgi:hypothetical protein